jgi:O-antigen/teichoic acid export membrane protein
MPNEGFAVQQSSKTENIMPAPPPMAGTLVRGTFWSVGVRWVLKFLGVINLAICARILTPADFGLVNMATVALGFTVVLFDFGLETALIRNQQADRGHYDTAWSLRLLETLAIGGIVILSASFIASIYEDPRVASILVILGVFVIISGLQNIATVDLRKNLNFRAEFVFSVVPKVISFLIGITAVIYFRTYWGLVTAICSGYVAQVILSYILVPYRPRWSLSHYREILAFSLWFLLQGIARFVTGQMDRFFIGILGGARDVGLYSMGREVGELPVSELALPVSRALTPTLAKLNSDSERLHAAVEKALGGLILIAAPLAVGFALVSQEFIYILFGEKWLSAVPIAKIVGISAIFSSYFGIALNILVVIGRERQAAFLGCIQAIAILIVLYPAYTWWGLEGIAWQLVCTGAVMALIISLYMQHLGIFRGLHTAANLARPCAAAVVMYFVVTASAPLIPENVFFALLTKAVIGATVYMSLVVGLWLAAGRPKSTEDTILSLAAEYIARFR